MFWADLKTMPDQSPAQAGFAPPAENTLPLPYVIARKMRGPHVRQLPRRCRVFSAQPSPAKDNLARGQFVPWGANGNPVA